MGRDGHRREDVVDAALRLLDRYGLADLTMRRLATELGVGPSALYHHFPAKQHLLAAVADTLLERGARPVEGDAWRDRVASCAATFRDAMLAYPDGAELVATVRAFGLGGAAPYDALLAELDAAGLPEETARVAAGTLVHFVVGHTLHEQTGIQAQSAGAVPDAPVAGGAADFEAGLDMVLDGIAMRSRSGTRSAAR